MSKKTLEEKIILMAYDHLKNLDDFKQEIELSFFSKKLNITPKKIKNIFKSLNRAGFFKKIDENHILITSKAIVLAEEIRKK